MPGAIHVLDLDNQHALVVDKSRFVADLGEAHSERHFRVLNGNESFANSVSEGISLVPLDYELAQNFPNPFNPVTHIPYTLKQQQDVRLEIFNVLGQLIGIDFKTRLPPKAKIRFSGQGGHIMNL